MSRDLELERAILDDPLALAPRSVYADWLQSQGSALGEWAALQAALHERDELRLRVAALEYLERHAAAVLGEAPAAVLDGVYLAWHGGFLDEIRLHDAAAMDASLTPDACLRALLAAPLGRFVRTIALGAFRPGSLPGGDDALLDVIAEAAPPLLEALVFDRHTTSAARPTRLADHLAALPRLRRLGVTAPIARDLDWTRLPSGLEELVLLGPSDPRGATLASLQELVWIEPGELAASVALPVLPALRRLRVICARESLPALLAGFQRAGVLEQLELLDLSHSGDPGATSILARWRARIPTLELHYGEDSLRSVFEASPDGVSWLSTRLATEGRDALAVTPLAGLGLYNDSCQALRHGRFAEGLVQARAAVSLPERAFGAWGWGNVGYALEQMRRHEESELVAHEGLLRHGRNPNFYSLLLGSLRVQGRIDEALGHLDEALASITAQARLSEAQVCLLDVVLVLDRAGQHARAFRIVRQKKLALDHRLHAALVLVHVALGDLAAAAKHLASADEAGDDTGISHHARAAYEMACGHVARAKTAIAKARKLGYADAAYLDEDPRLQPGASGKRAAAMTGTKAKTKTKTKAKTKTKTKT